MAQTPQQAPRQRSARQDYVTATWAAQARVVQELITEADAAVNAVSGCASWLAVRRQARSFRRHLDAASPRLLVGLDDEVGRHQEMLAQSCRRAKAELAVADPDACSVATARLGIRFALIGKGGVGKTVIAATLARLLARRGRSVLAVDLDTNPGLALSLGAPTADAGLPAAAVEEQAGSSYGWALATGLTPEHAVRRYGAAGPDGVRFLGVGKIAAVDKDAARRSLAAVLSILLGFGAPDWDVIADLEAGPTTPFERYHAFAEDVAVVVGPAWRSAMTARRLLPMVGERRTLIVANRFHGEPDHPGLVPAICIPFDPDVAEAERAGLAPLDACPDSPAIAAIAALATLLVSQEVSV